jgi:hypothetical protein
VTHIPINGHRNNEPEETDLIETVQNAPLEVKKKVVEEALGTADKYGNGPDLIRHVMSTAPSKEIRTAAVGKAVETADKENEREILEKGFREAHADTQNNIAKQHGPSQGTLDRVWQWTVATFAIVLGIATIGLFVVIGWDTVVAPQASAVDPSHLQIMLTVFTTTAGILAGFITGHAVGKASEEGGERK